MWQLAGLVGSMMSAYGSMQSGLDRGRAADLNADIEGDNASFAQQAGEDKAKMILHAGDRAVSSIRNRASASGLAADTGSPLLVQEEALYQSSLDAAKTRYAGKVAAYGSNQRASLYRMAGRQAINGGYFRASASLMSLAGSSYSKGKGVPVKDESGIEA